jgi:hypothetical protein
MASVLFDEAHGELLSSLAVPEKDQETDTRTLLEQKLRALGMTIFSQTETWCEETLNDCQVLAIIAPTASFSLYEIEAVEEFVRDGGGLVLTANAEALWRQPDDSFNLLAERLGLRFEHYYNVPPEKVHDFKPHFISSGVGQISTWEVSTLTPLESSAIIQPRVLATIPETGEAFVTAVEVGQGRVVAIGDFILFGDKELTSLDNCTLASNLFHWLAFENPVDCRSVQAPETFLLGHTGSISVTLSNPNPERVERVRCLLESDAGATIERPVLQIRSIPPRGQIWLQWSVIPQRLGSQRLSLTVDWPRARKGQEPPLFFDRLSEFTCQAPVELHVRALDETGEPRIELDRGQTFVVEGRVTWNDEAQLVPLDTDLTYRRRDLRLLRRERLDGLDRWHLEAVALGEHRVGFRIVESGQSVSLVVKVKESLQQWIDRLQADVVVSLDNECLRLTTRIREEFEVVKSIPFCLMTPEDYVELVYPPEVARRLWAALASARREKEQNLPLLKQILANVAPLYSPKHGCYVPFDPELARRWADLHPLYQESIAQNLVYISGYNKDANDLLLDQNVVAYLLHEKYGHGFFYTQTQLGQQLAILYRQGFLRRADAARLAHPYPYQLYEAYRRAVEALTHSAIIVNEGFAAWVETQVLPKMGSEIAPAAHRRKTFLMTQDRRLETLARRSEYFKRFSNLQPSRYQEGHEYFDFIADRYFGEPWGPKCAVQAMLIAADVHLGITKTEDTVQFGLTPEEMEEALLEVKQDDARADMRLRRIHSVLRQYQDWVRTEQRRLHCYRECLHSECPVNGIIAEKLGWEVKDAQTRSKRAVGQMVQTNRDRRRKSF